MRLRFKAVRWLYVVLPALAVFSAHAFAQESSENVEQSVGSIAETESQFLFINMLEFLAEFETDAGEWLSPDILADEAFTDLDVGSTGNNRFNADVNANADVQDSQ